MRTSLNELRKLEKYLQKQLNPQDQLLLDAQLLLDKDLKDNLCLQQKCYRLINAYGRAQLRSQLNRVEEELFSQPVHKKFMQQVSAYFK